MANRKQTKRELKAAKRAAHEAARRAERRRSLITAGIVVAVLVVGGALIGFTVLQDRSAAAEQQRAAEEAASQAAQQASEAAEEIANRDVACDAEAPGTEGDKPTFDEPGEVREPDTDYGAVIDTSCGQITLDLAENDAPETVNSFLFLAQEGFYDGLEIFRNAASIGALQTGSGTNDAGWQIGYTLPDELDLAESDGYPAGTVAMANAGPDSGGSQFFFVYNDSFSLEPTFTRFATVTDGLDVLSTIGEVEAIGPQGETPGEAVYINSVEIVEGVAPTEATASEAPTSAETSSEE
ncbi:hypothetical protein BH23ACT10_BH23ACT10_01440 [soil metagenome]